MAMSRRYSVVDPDQYEIVPGVKSDVVPATGTLAKCSFSHQPRVPRCTPAVSDPSDQLCFFQRPPPTDPPLHSAKLTPPKPRCPSNALAFIHQGLHSWKFPTEEADLSNL